MLLAAGADQDRQPAVRFGFANCAVQLVREAGTSGRAVSSRLKTGKEVLASDGKLACWGAAVAVEQLAVDPLALL